MKLYGINGGYRCLPRKLSCFVVKVTYVICCLEEDDSLFFSEENSLQGDQLISFGQFVMALCVEIAENRCQKARGVVMFDAF